MSRIDKLPSEEQIERYRELANQRAAYAETLQENEARYELLIANAWKQLADYLEAGRSKLPSP